MAIYADLPKLGRVKLPSGNTYALIDSDLRLMVAPSWTADNTYKVGDIYRWDSVGLNVTYTVANPQPTADTFIPNYYYIQSAGKYVIATTFTSGLTYYVSNAPVNASDNLYICVTDHTSTTASPVLPSNITYWKETTIAEIIEDMQSMAIDGIHYRGKTSTALCDGAKTNPIIINSESYSAKSGDLVIVDLPSASSTYATGTAYNKHQYIKYNDKYYHVNENIIVAENTSFEAIASPHIAKVYETNVAYSQGDYLVKDGSYYYVTANIAAGTNTSWSAISSSVAETSDPTKSKVSLLRGEPEFIYSKPDANPGIWNAFGGDGDSFGTLAYKDSAVGTYEKPTGSGSVTVKEYASVTGSISTTSIYGVSGSVTASKATAGTAKDIAKVGTAVVAGTADPGTEVTVGTELTGTTSFNTNAIKAASVSGTNVFVTSAINGASVTGTSVFTTEAIKAASLTSTTTFNTDAIKAASLTGDKTFTKDGVTVAVDGDCLSFSASTTGTVGISTTPASTGTVSIDTTPSPTGSFSITTSNAPTGSFSITTTAADKSSVGLSTTNVIPAKLATREITPAVSNGTITPYTFADVTVPKQATAATQVAIGPTGGIEIMTSVTATDVAKTVTVGTTTDTVTVR